jgi:HAD superfamily hydrolase (TIGR01509 family)
MKQFNIKTLVFDLGGVYFTSGTSLAIDKIIDIYNIKKHHQLREFFRDGYQKEGQLIRLGLLTMDEFEKRLISKFNIQEKNIHHIRHLWFGSYVPLWNMEKLIDKLKDKYQLVVFSGNIRERIDFLDNRYQFSEKFDDFLYSFEVKLNKGQIEFYKELLNHIECEPSEAIVIDDERKAIRFAQAVGFNTILYYYTEQLIDDLKKYGIEINL